jgi:PPOX class probable F420-dependent enzyme
VTAPRPRQTGPMALDPADLGDAVVSFLAERHLATLTTLRGDGSPHVVPVGFAYDAADRVVRIITQRHSQKARNAARGGRAAVSQVDGRRWLTLEGTVRLVTDPPGVARAVAAYTERYQAPRERPDNDRVAIEIAVDRVLGRGGRRRRAAAQKPLRCETPSTLWHAGHIQTCALPSGSTSRWRTTPVSGCSQCGQIGTKPAGASEISTTGRRSATQPASRVRQGNSFRYFVAAGCGSISRTSAG